MNYKQYCTPLTVRLTPQLQLYSVYSIGDSTGLNISGCDYADLINFDAILSAKPHPTYGQISIIKNSTFLDIARGMTKDEHLGVLLLDISNKLVLIVDTDRELLVEIMSE